MQVIRTILSVAQRIRPTSSPPLSPRRGPTRSSSTQLPEDSLSDTSFPPSSDPEASDSSYSPRQASERGATRKAMSVRRPTMRKAAISFAGDSPDAHQMKRQRFYGMDRRVSESAIDLVSIEEEADGGGKFRRGRHNEGTEAIGARKDAPLVSDEPVNVSAVLSDAAMSPSSRPEALAISRPSLISRAIATHDTTADRGSDFAAVRPKVRRSSASSTSSVPFPSSSDIIKPKAPIRSPSRPVHHRTASEVQVARHDNISQRSRAESLSSVSATEDGRLKRRSQSHSRHQITFNDGARQQTYQLGAQIGSGQFGSVYRALDTYLGRVVAVKRIKIMGRSEEEIEQVVHEVDVLRKVAHPCQYLTLLSIHLYIKLISQHRYRQVRRPGQNQGLPKPRHGVSPELFPCFLGDGQTNWRHADMSKARFWMLSRPMESSRSRSRPHMSLKPSRV